MRAAMQCERRCVVNTEMAMRCDAEILAMRALVAQILGDAPPRCENTSDAMTATQRLRLLMAGLSQEEMVMSWAVSCQTEVHIERPRMGPPKGIEGSGRKEFLVTVFKCVFAQAFCSQKSFREIALNYAKLP